MGWSGEGRRLPPTQFFTLLPAPDNIVHVNSRICDKCYNIHRRPHLDPDVRTQRVSGRELRRYAKAVKENEQRLRPRQLLHEGLSAAASEPPGEKRRPLAAKRLSGAGRKSALTAEQERWLRD